MFKVFLIVLATSGNLSVSQGKAVDIIQMESVHECQVLGKSVYKMAASYGGHNQFKVKCVRVKEQTK